jgi:hypothetical protein
MYGKRFPGQVELATLKLREGIRQNSEECRNIYGIFRRCMLSEDKYFF